MADYKDITLYIGGTWVSGNGLPIDIINPASGEKIGVLTGADKGDLERAVKAAESGFMTWSRMSALERSGILRKAASIIRDRKDQIARILTTDEGKPLVEAGLEVASSADLLDWFAEEGRRAYGRIIPARSPRVRQYAIRSPVGIATGFTPWNFPMSQIVRKLGPALAAGCAIIVKGAEEAPGSCAALFECLHDAGLPAGAAGLVFGVPSEVSEYLIPHPSIAKISFTGSVPVGKHLASLAGQHMKRITMELGGHAPVIVTGDAEIDVATTQLVGAKYRNAGQVCIAPTRFLIEDSVHDEFVSLFCKKAAALKVGNGLDEGVQMGPLINSRRLNAVEGVIADAVSKGAKVETGGQRLGNEGTYFQPTVLTGVNENMLGMNEEPFGPIALIRSFSKLDDAIAEANRLPFGLGSYAYTSTESAVRRLLDEVKVGMMTINHIGLGLPETPYGGVRDSGFGYEGGSEALDGYLDTRFASHFV